MKRPHRKAHRVSALALLVAVPLILIAALLVRQDPADAPPPERLEAPQLRGGGQ